MKGENKRRDFLQKKNAEILILENKNFLHFSQIYLSRIKSRVFHLSPCGLRDLHDFKDYSPVPSCCRKIPLEVLEKKNVFSGILCSIQGSEAKIQKCLLSLRSILEKNKKHWGFIFE